MLALGFLLVLPLLATGTPHLVAQGGTYTAMTKRSSARIDEKRPKPNMSTCLTYSCALQQLLHRP